MGKPESENREDWQFEVAYLLTKNAAEIHRRLTGESEEQKKERFDYMVHRVQQLEDVKGLPQIEKLMLVLRTYQDMSLDELKQLEVAKAPKHNWVI